MRKAPLGFRAMILLAFHGLLSLIGVLNVFPFFHTIFYPVFPLLALVASLVGLVERDRMKWPSVVAGLTALGLIIHWVIMLITTWQ